MRIASHEINVDPTVAVPHTASLTALAAVIMGWLPVVVALIPAIYYLFLIFETKTVQEWRRRRRNRKLAKRRRQLRHQKLRD